MAASDRVRRILSEVRELSVEEKAELETELLAGRNRKQSLG